MFVNEHSNGRMAGSTLLSFLYHLMDLLDTDI